jgi:hypothetical protein
LKDWVEMKATTLDDKVGAAEAQEGDLWIIIDLT